jgi:hypothetical protein
MALKYMNANICGRDISIKNNSMPKIFYKFLLELRKYLLDNFEEQ